MYDIPKYIILKLQFIVHLRPHLYEKKFKILSFDYKLHELVTLSVTPGI